MIAVRCLCCGVLFTSGSAYRHPSHLCCSRAQRDTANVHTVEQPTTASVPLGGAVVIPFPTRQQVTA